MCDTDQERRRARRVCAALVLCAASPAAAQTWMRSSGGAALEQAHGILQTADRGYITAGVTGTFGGGGQDVFVVRSSPCGAPVWQRSYGGTGDDQAFAVVATAGGGVILAGETESAAGDLDLLLIELNAAGAIVWQTAVGGVGDERARSAAATPDGGFVVAGIAGTDAFVLRFNASRAIVWQTIYAGVGDEIVSAVRRVADGGFIVAGATDSFGAGSLDGWLLKIDSSGSVVWQRALGGSMNDAFNDVIAAEGAGFLAVGFTDSFGAGLSDAWAVRVDGAGSVLWQKAYGGVDDDEALAAGTAAEPWIVAGYSRSLGPGDEDGWVAGLDAAGGIVWQRRLGGVGDDVILAAVSAVGGGVILGGVRASDLWMVKLERGGVSGPACGLGSPAALSATGTSASLHWTTASVTATSEPSRSPAWTGQPAAAANVAVCSATAGEVSPPGAAQALVFTDATSLLWEPAALNCASSFNLYRGELTDLPAGDFGACLDSGLTTATVADTDPPPLPGTGFTYLVTAKTAGVEGSAGYSSDGSPRTPSVPCP